MLLDGVRDRGAELVALERLLQVVTDAVAQTGHRRLDRRGAGDQDDGVVGTVPPDLARQPHTVPPRQFDVAHRDRHPCAAHHLDRLLRGRGLGDPIAVVETPAGNVLAPI